MSALVDPTIDRKRVSGFANAVLAVLAQEKATPFEQIHALCWALASVCYSAGVTNFEDVEKNLRFRWENVKAARGARGGQSSIRVVSPEQFTAIAKRFGVKFD